MVWLRKNDVGYDEPLTLAVGNAAYGAQVRMEQWASTHRTNGWIPEQKAREIASRAELKRLMTAYVDLGKPLHEHGDDCLCLKDHDWSPDRGGFWLHDFLKGNPSRAENDVHRAKARELKDKELRAAVKRRDGDLCRYCGITVKWADRKTAEGGVLDHVDPRKAEGAANLVVACRGCNGRKKDCTPEAAGMELRSAPGDVNGSTPNLRAINGGSRSDQRPDLDPDLDPGADPDPGREPGSPSSTSTNPGPALPENDPINGEINDRMTTGTGRGGPGNGPRSDRASPGYAGPDGYRPTVGPAATPRDHLNPSPYLKYGQPSGGDP